MHILYVLEQGMKTFEVRIVDSDMITILAGVLFWHRKEFHIIQY